MLVAIDLLLALEKAISNLFHRLSERLMLSLRIGTLVEMATRDTTSLVLMLTCL